jgi:hypothetical protein
MVGGVEQQIGAQQLGHGRLACHLEGVSTGVEALGCPIDE